MKLARGLLAAFVATLLLLAGAAAALFTLDLGGLVRPLTRWAGNELQRPLAIDGPVSIRAGRTLRFRAGGVRLANAPWGSRGDMLLVRSVYVEVDAASLIRRPVIVRRIEIDGLDLLLEQQDDGTSNWQFSPDTSDVDFRWPESLPVVVEGVSLPGARIRFIGPRLDRPLELRFDRLEQRRLADGMLGLTARGAANDEPVSLEGAAGPFTGLVAGRDFSVALDGRVGELDVNLELRVDDIARPANSQLDLNVRGPGAEYLTTRFGVPDLGSGPLSLEAVVRPSADGTGVAGELTGEIGQFTVKARGVLADPATLRRARAELDITGPDLRFVGALAGAHQLPPDPFELTATVERAGELLRIDAATLSVADASVDLKGTVALDNILNPDELEFRFRGANLRRFRDFLSLPPSLRGAFDISGTLKASDGVEQIDVSATTTLGQATLSGPLGTRPDLYGTRLDLTASGPSLARVGDAAGLKGLPGVNFRATANIEWTADGAIIRRGQLRGGPDHLTVDGRVGRKPLARGTDVNWSLRGPDLHALAASFGIDEMPAGAFDLRGRLRREPRVSRLDNVRGTVAGAQLHLSGRIADTPMLGTTLDISLEGPRLEAFASLVPDYPLPPGEFRVAGGIALKPERVILHGMQLAAAGAEGTVDADLELPLSAVRGDFQVTAKGENLVPFLPWPGSAESAPLPFDLHVRGRAEGGVWRLDEAEFSTETGQISASGRLDWAPDFSATALDVVARTDDLSMAGHLLGVELPSRYFELTASFTGTPTAFRVEQATGRLGKTDFDGRLQLELGERTVLDVEIRSDLLDLTPFFADSQPTSAAAPEASPGRGRRRDSPRLIPESLIPLGWLDEIDGSLTLRAERALFATVALDELRLAARLKGGTLTLDSLEMQAPPDGRLSLSGRLESRAGRATVQLAATGERVRLARLDDTPAVRDARPLGEFAMAFTGEGATWRELAQSLDGGFQLRTGAGFVPARSLDVLFGGLWRDLVTTVVPGIATREVTSVRCIAVFATTTAGVLRTAPAIVMQTDRVNIVTHGSVDLRTEQLGFHLRTGPRRGRVGVTVAEIVNPYIRITGTLANPGLGVDQRGVLFSGGAAVATAGMSILARGVWDRMFRARDPCAVAAAEAARLTSGEARRRTLFRWPWRRR